MALAPNPGVARVWGPHLFENSHALDIITALNASVDLPTAEESLNTKRLPQNLPPIRLSPFAPLCTTQECITAVRNHIFARNLLCLTHTQLSHYLSPTQPIHWTDHGYTCVILGACLLSLGLDLRAIPLYENAYFATYYEFLRGVYEFAPLTDESKRQVEEYLAAEWKMLRSDVRWECEGVTELEFFFGQTEKRMKGEERKAKSVVFEGGRPKGYVSAREVRLPGEVVVVKAKSRVVVKNGEKICGGCGKDGAGLKCSRCQIDWYCGKECQKRAWAEHKKECRSPEVEADMADEAKWTNQFIVVETKPSGTE